MWNTSKYHQRIVFFKKSAYIIMVTILFYFICYSWLHLWLYIFESEYKDLFECFNHLNMRNDIFFSISDKNLLLSLKYFELYKLENVSKLLCINASFCDCYLHNWWPEQTWIIHWTNILLLLSLFFCCLLKFNIFIFYSIAF